MKYTHVVFDVDGTLLDTEQAEMEALQRALQETLGQSRPYETLRAVFGITGQDGLARIGYTPEESDKVFPRWHELSRELICKASLFEGIAETLRELRARGCTLGIVTSRSREGFLLGMRPHGLQDSFAVTVCMEDTEQHKPNPAPLLAYQKKAGVSVAEMLYVGDSVYDMQCARAAGVDSALALWGAQELQTAAVYCLKSPKELLKIIE